MVIKKNSQVAVSSVKIVKNGIFIGGFIYPGVDAMNKTYSDISLALNYPFNFDIDISKLPIEDYPEKDATNYISLIKDILGNDKPINYKPFIPEETISHQFTFEDYYKNTQTKNHFLIYLKAFNKLKLSKSDIQFLNTLPKREIICGYGEILKHSLIANKNFYNFLNRNGEKILKLSSPFIEKAIYESCKIKKNVVEKDEKEKNIRKILNFGHTFAHAYEASLGFSKKLNHGEAVILGMKSALSFSLKNNLLNKNDYNSILNHITKSNLPSEIKKFFKIKDLNKILSFMLKDKKNITDKINLVLLKRIGSPVINKEYKKNNLYVFLKNELRN